VSKSNESHHGYCCQEPASFQRGPRSQPRTVSAAPARHVTESERQCHEKRQACHAKTREASGDRGGPREKPVPMHFGFSCVSGFFTFFAWTKSLLGAMLWHYDFYCVISLDKPQMIPLEFGKDVVKWLHWSKPRAFFCFAGLYL